MLLAPLLEALQLLLEWAKAALDWLLQLAWPASTIVLEGGRRVRIKKQLAEGGFGYVYLAVDAQTGEAYALKNMRCQTREQLEAAKREILYHREFRHPNLLGLLDSAVQQQPHGATATVVHAYLLFPLCTGGSLREAIDRRLRLDIGSPTQGAIMPNPWPEAALLRLFRGVLLGVRELHQHKPPLAHRDIKPENVLLQQQPSPDGSGRLTLNPVLIDFGSMAAADVRVTSRSEALLVQEDAAMHCTLPYRPPELFDVASDAVLDSRVDVWALGCLLFAMAFGYSPFECDFPDGALRPRIVECSYLRVIGRVPFPAKHPYSPALVETIGWILQQNPKRRPFVTEVLARVNELIAAADASSSSVSSSKAAVASSGPSESVVLEMAPLGSGGRHMV